MPDSPVLETVLGLIFVSYALALFCAGAVEMISNAVKKRAKYLLRGIDDLLSDPVDQPASTAADVRQERSLYQEVLVGAPSSSGAVTVSTIINHGLAAPYKQLSARGVPKRNPSYLPSSVFTKALLDVVVSRSGGGPMTVAEVERAAETLQGNETLKGALLTLIKFSGAELKELTTAVEGWFDAQMDRVNGSYKRWAMRWVVVVATVVVLAGNVDGIAIARALYVEDSVRATVSQAAVADGVCPAGTAASACADRALDFFAVSALPIGRNSHTPDSGGWTVPLKLLGLALSIGAAALGAPFWHNVLDRVGSLRNAGKRPEPGS